MISNQLIDFFNTTTWNPSWDEDALNLFKVNCNALANNMAKPVLDRINNSEARKKVKTIVNNLSLEVESLQICKESTIENCISVEKPVKKITLSGSIDLPIGKELTKERFEEMAIRLANTIINTEKMYIDYVESLGLLDKATFYVIKEFVPIYDICLITYGKIGFFGWEEIAILISI